MTVLGKQQISVALAYDATRALHVCGFKKNSLICLNHHENVLDSINMGRQALFVCIFYLRDHIFVLCSRCSPLGFVRSDRIVRESPMSTFHSLS